MENPLPPTAESLWGPQSLCRETGSILQVSFRKKLLSTSGLNYILKDSVRQLPLLFIYLILQNDYMILQPEWKKQNQNTMILIRRLQVVAIPQQGAHGLAEAVLIRLLGSVIKKGVRNKAGVSSILYILQGKERCVVIKAVQTAFGNETTTKYRPRKLPFRMSSSGVQKLPNHFQTSKT